MKATVDRVPHETRGPQGERNRDEKNDRRSEDEVLTRLDK